MGVYTYTFRAKTTNFHFDGIVLTAHHYCFAYKHHSWNSRSDDFRINNFHRHADAAFAARKSEYVVMCDEKHGVRDGDLIYKNPKGPSWVDVKDFGAEPVGFAKKVGRQWMLMLRSEWTWNSKGTTLDNATGLWLGYVTKEFIDVRVDGTKFVNREQQYADFATQKFVTREEALDIANKKLTESFKTIGDFAAIAEIVNFNK